MNSSLRESCHGRLGTRPDLEQAADGVAVEAIDLVEVVDHTALALCSSA